MRSRLMILPFDESSSESVQRAIPLGVFLQLDERQFCGHRLCAKDRVDILDRADILALRI